MTQKLGPVLDVLSYSNGFTVFSCAKRAEEYGDFMEYAEITGQLDKWSPMLESVTEVKILNEFY